MSDERNNGQRDPWRDLLVLQERATLALESTAQALLALTEAIREQADAIADLANTVVDEDEDEPKYDLSGKLIQPR